MPEIDRDSVSSDTDNGKFQITQSQLFFEDNEPVIFFRENFFEKNSKFFCGSWQDLIGFIITQLIINLIMEPLKNYVITMLMLLSNTKKTM